MKYYAGIGSRKTPPDILDIMDRLAIKLEQSDYTLRSGGADGADKAFAQSVTNKQIFIPWKGFNNIDSEFIGAASEAYELAEKLHPAWNRCSQGAKKLHARNIHQILGPTLSPDEYSSFVVCWTPNGNLVGGTATAIKLANNNNIEVINLGHKSHLDRVLKYINKI